MRYREVCPGWDSRNLITRISRVPADRRVNRFLGMEDVAGVGLPQELETRARFTTDTFRLRSRLVITPDPTDPHEPVDHDDDRQGRLHGLHGSAAEMAGSGLLAFSTAVADP